MRYSIDTSIAIGNNFIGGYMLPSAFKPKRETVNFILMHGGVGDHVSSLVALNHIIKNYPWITPLIWTPDFLTDFAKHLLPKAIINNYTSMARKYDSRITTKTTAWDGIISPMKIHCLDYAFLKLCDENPGVEHKNFLQIDPSKINYALPDKPYVVITTGYTAAVREFPAEHINNVAKYLVDKGVTPVFLGQTSTATGANHTIKGTFASAIDFSIGINLIDKTALLEAAKIMSGAKAVIGVDNGLLHIAGCTNVPIIGGFTTVDPKSRLPVRNSILGHNYYAVTPDLTLSCSFCQVKTNFLYGHEYTKCLRQDAICTKQMTAAKFINHLEKIL